MTIRSILTLFALAMTVSGISALTIHTEPGKLAAQKPQLIHTSETALVLKGTANVTDLAILKEMSRTITSLDMSQLTIAGYTYSEGDYLGQTSFEAGELPKAMLLDTNISEFIFPSQTSKIGSSAFAATALESVTIPESVTFIGDYAFSGCKKLKSAVVPGDAGSDLGPQWGIGVFQGCTDLKTVSFGYDIETIPSYTFDGCNGLSSQIPASVTAVGSYAYRGTPLASINLSNVATVGDYAFAQMPNLSEISFNSSEYPKFGTGAFFGDELLALFPTTIDDIPALLVANTAGGDKITVNAAVIGEAAYANNPNIQEITLGANVHKIKANAFRNDSKISLINVSQLESNIPYLDSSAFSGLEDENGRYPIQLNVAKDTENNWKEHPVWGLFNIMAGGSNLGSVSLKAPIQVYVSREGELITVSSESIIESLYIYTLEGHILHESRPMAESATVTGIDPGAVVIIKVEQGKNVKIVKLAASR